MTSSDVGFRFASRIASRINAAFGGSMSPSTWMTAMPALCVRPGCTRLRAGSPARPERGRGERAEHESEQQPARGSAATRTG